MADVIVVGGGVMGATIANAVMRQRVSVKLISDNRTGMGSIPSGGHMKPSWSSMTHKEFDAALGLLDECWDVIEEEYEVRSGPADATRPYDRDTLYRIDIDNALRTAESWMTRGRVVKIEGEPEAQLVHWISLGNTRQTVVERCKVVIVATGVWIDELFPDIKVQAKQGVSFRFAGTTNPFILPWAPYKQVVAHQQEENQIWIGDGSAILEQNWNAKRRRQCRDRCKDALGLDEDRWPTHIHTGLRPYAKLEENVPCLLQRISKRVWAVTGAGKQGTIASAWAALRILEDLPI